MRETPECARIRGMDASGYFRSKKITVMGLGLLGRGVGDAQYLAECGADLVVTDLKSREDLASSVRQLGSFSNIRFVLGGHNLEDFTSRDLIVKAAGVPLDSPYIAEARKNHIPVRMSADLFAELSGVPIIGITGTRGKSTVAHMIYAILKEAKQPVLLGGNVRGVSTLALLREVKTTHMAVLELDSWQCQGFGEAKISPHIAIFTTFFSDHLNYYKNNLDAYLADKANIFLNQKSDDILILGAQVSDLLQKKYDNRMRSHITIASATDLPGDWELKIPGEHNRYNAAIARAAVRAHGIPDETSRRALESFSGVPGRLELVTERSGVKIYNDTTATTPEATLAALHALNPVRPILIMGGTDKGLDMSALTVTLSTATKRIVLLAGTGTNRIRHLLPAAPVYSVLTDAVEDAVANAVSGDAILFSPAFASFGMFKNEYDRGDQFNAAIGIL